VSAFCGINVEGVVATATATVTVTNTAAVIAASAAVIAAAVIVIITAAFVDVDGVIPIRRPVFIVDPLVVVVVIVLVYVDRDASEGKESKKCADHAV
jgi:hypothetical protein